MNPEEYLGLAAAVGRLARAVQALEAERDALASKLAAAEAERDALKESKPES